MQLWAKLQRPTITAHHLKRAILYSFLFFRDIPVRLYQIASFCFVASSPDAKEEKY